MRKWIPLSAIAWICAVSVWAQESAIRYEFSGKTAEENSATLQGAGFGAYPQAIVEFGYIPTDNAFDGATDGQGVLITAQPGEGVMIFGQTIASQNAAVIRCSVRTDSAHAQVTLAAIGGAPDTFVSTNSPANEAYFQGQYKRLGVLVTPPAGGFTPVLQILNTSATEPLTAYVDNLEIYFLDRFYGYHGEFLNCDETDPAGDAIQKELTGNESGMMGPEGKTSTRSTPPIQPDGVSVDNFIRLDYSGKTAEANSVSLQGAGFGAYPQASVSFSYLPTDNAFDGATDGQGAIIEAKPGEGVMIFGPSLTNNKSAMIRCNVRTEGANAAITIAAIGAEPDRFVSTSTTNNPGYFQGQYKRLSVFAVPPAGGLQPVIQIVNTSETEPLIAYLDNFDVIVIDSFSYYYGEFLNGDETDPSNGQIGFPADDSSTAFTQQTLDINLTSSVKMRLLSVPSGSFTMGSPSTETDRSDTENPQRIIQISKSFYIGEAEVTQKQWAALMNNNPSQNYIGDNMPVNYISWNDCQTFIAKLNALNQGKFRLPTEAEWEYCCRATKTTRFYWGDDAAYTDFGQYCNSTTNANVFALLNVRSLMPNGWKLYDMSGNVMEYCSDWYESPYSTTILTDPTGPSTGTYKALRGGCYSYHPRSSRSAARYIMLPDTPFVFAGLRVVREM